jgi:antitoxin component of MazEF toxin-antitoxin module
MYVLDTRSLIEIRGSLLVTLPISWVRHNALTKGRKVSVALDDRGQLAIPPTTTEKRNGIPAAGADIGVTTPGAGGHRTQGAGAGVNIN